MSLEIVTTSTAGGVMDAPAALSSTTADGAGNGVPFAALLDEQAGTDANLCPQIVGHPVVPDGARAAETVQTAPGSSLSALGIYNPFSTGTADPNDVPVPAAGGDDESDDSDAADAMLEVVLLPFVMATATDVTLTAAGGSTPGASVAAGAEQAPTVSDAIATVALAGAQTSADAAAPVDSKTAPDAVVQADPSDATTPVLLDAASKLTAQPARLGKPATTTAGAQALTADDLKQMAQAALRARLAEVYTQASTGTEPAAASSTNATRLPQDQAPALFPASGDPASPADVASRSRAAVADAVARAFSGSSDSGTASDEDGGAGGQSQAGASDHAPTLASARTATIVQPVAPFDATLATAGTESGQSAAARAATIPNEAHVTSSIVQSMRLQMRDGVGTAVVHLEPDYLGPVTINLRVAGGAVTASLHAENPQVRAWLEANEGTLRQALSDQGLSLDRLLVSAERPSDEQDAADRQRQPQEEAPPRRQPKPDESRTFEVIV